MDPPNSRSRVMAVLCTCASRRPHGNHRQNCFRECHTICVCSANACKSLCAMLDDSLLVNPTGSSLIVSDWVAPLQRVQDTLQQVQLGWNLAV